MRRTGSILISDLLLLVLCVLGVYRFAQKAGFPAKVEYDGSICHIATTTSRFLLQNDAILKIDGQRVNSNEEIELLCNEFAIGAWVRVDVIRDGILYSQPIPLSGYYTLSSVILQSIAGLIFFCIGLFVVLRRSSDKAALAFHHLCVAISALILLTSGRFTLVPVLVGYGLEFLFLAAYIAVPIFFIQFVTTFPISDSKVFRHSRTLLFTIGIGLLLWSSVMFANVAIPAVRLEKFYAYEIAYTAVKLFFVLAFFCGLIILYQSYRRTTEDFERRKLRWIFFGIVAGACDYIFLYLLPQIVLGTEIITIDIVLIFSIIAPISFAIAIVRFRIFDIDLLIKRSTIYSAVISLLLMLYLGIVALLSTLVGKLNLPTAVPTVAGALLVAILFEPLRKRIQILVDKRFFKITYNFHEAQSEFFDQIKYLTTVHQMAEMVITKIVEILPVTRIGFFTLDSASDIMTLQAHHGFDILSRRGVRLRKEQLKTGLDLPVLLEDQVEQGLFFEKADSEVFKRWDISAALPMLSVDRDVLGFLVLGEKLSRARFTLEDISLLTSVSAQTGLALERIRLGRELTVEQAESERLTELNRLKSYFVSSVSHDLKTPLTSIRLFAELMKENDALPRRKTIEYLEIIEGEADRLSRLITNVLDFAKIERGTKTYSFTTLDLNLLISEVINSLEYQIYSRGFTMMLELSSAPIVVNADHDAVFDVLTNLITNAMKYSPPERQKITISSSFEEDSVMISVIDQGYGIADSEMQSIFEPFYRIPEGEMRSSGGAGIGLSLVKHTMVAHGGGVEVRSEVGKGSIFVLYFPKLKS